MQKSYRFLVSFLFLGAYMLSACTGVVPQQDGSPGSSSSTEAVFTGSVESVGGTQWLISGQQVNVDGSTSIDTNIQVGDIVRVEATVSQDGIVLALKIESSGADDAGANDNSANSNDDNANTNDNSNANANSNSNDSSNANSNTNDNSNSAPAGAENETFGLVEAITPNSITIGGVTYRLAKFTEFKHLIAVGDRVKIHVVVGADGTLTIREIERTTGTGIGDNKGNSNQNSNSNNNGNDDNTNNNSNGDDDNHNSNDNSNDDDDHDDNSNNSNSNGG